jgi:hypothetical protein
MFGRPSFFFSSAASDNGSLREPLGAKASTASRFGGAGDAIFIVGGVVPGRYEEMGILEI